jgi:hypothetical protein
MLVKNVYMAGKILIMHLMWSICSVTESGPED